MSCTRVSNVSHRWFCVSVIWNMKSCSHYIFILIQLWLVLYLKKCIQMDISKRTECGHKIGRGPLRKRYPFHDIKWLLISHQWFGGQRYPILSGYTQLCHYVPVKSGIIPKDCFNNINHIQFNYIISPWHSRTSRTKYPHDIAKKWDIRSIARRSLKCIHHFAAASDESSWRPPPWIWWRCLKRTVENDSRIKKISFCM